MNVLFRKPGVIVVSAYGSQAVMAYSNDAGGVFTATFSDTREALALAEMKAAHAPNLPSIHDVITLEAAALRELAAMLGIKQ